MPPETQTWFAALIVLVTLLAFILRAKSKRPGGGCGTGCGCGKSQPAPGREQP